MEQGLSRTRARDLDKFIEVHLLPNTSFRTEVKAAIKIICDFLKERCFRGATHPVRVSKVVKVSAPQPELTPVGRERTLRIQAAALSGDFEDQLERRGEFIEEIRKQLCNFQRELHIWVKIEVQSSWWPNPRALSFKLSSFQHQQEVEFDVLPAYDVLGQLNYIKPHPQIYADLIRECTSLGKEGEFSTCFTELQRNFLKSRPTKLKSLIRLVKHWYQLCKEKLGKPLPQQYALELLTVYAWERGSGVTEFNTAQGFRTVLELVVEYRQLRIYWTEYYDFQHEDVSKYLLRQLRKDRQGSQWLVQTPYQLVPVLDQEDEILQLGWPILQEVLLGLREADGELALQPQPDETFLNQIKKAVDIICTFLKENCFRHSSTKVLKTVKGGSTAKGTALKYGSDADIVVFLSSLESYESQKQERPQFVQEIRRQLEAFQQTQKLEVKFEVSKWKAPRVLSFTLKSRNLNESVNFDVLPAYDALEAVQQSEDTAALRMEQGLSRTWACDLDKFIEAHLLPNTSFRTEVKAAIKIICDFLKERCFRDAAHPVRVSKVVKGGSSGKGTALKGRSDADLVVFLNNLTSFEDQLKRRGEFIQEIKKQLYELQHRSHIKVKFEVQSSKQSNLRALSFKLSSYQLQQEVEFDVLPAYDVLGQLNCSKPNPGIYSRLIRECTSLGKEGEFSTCFTELQRNFLKHRPPKLKSLIRLVKHWYQLCKEKLRELLPPQYALELLTVYAWERGSGVTEFNTAQGFRTVLELVTKYRQLRIYWTEYYDFQDQEVSNYLRRQLRKNRECTSKKMEGEFSTSFTELQRNFLKRHPPKLKSLIRLVKHWYQLCKEKLGKPLPPQYALELLTVYAWERGSGFTEFNTAQGFRTVLELVTNYRQLRIYWTVYYDFRYEYVSNYLHNQLSRPRPVILDPADPTRNTAGLNSDGWCLLAEEAMAWLKYPCFENWDGSPVRSWDVPDTPSEKRWLTEAWKKTVMQILTPTTPRQVCEFLGTASFCRLWIPGFTMLAAPLYPLTKEKVPFTWTKEHQRVFDKIKTALLTAPELTLPDLTKLFTLYVDEQAGVARGVLTQTLGPWKRPVAYLSKKLDPVASRWPSCLKAIAAVALLVKDDDNLTVGQHVTVIAPHALESIVWQPPDRWMTNARMTHYQSLLLNDQITFAPPAILNPATLLPEAEDSTPVHRCTDVLAEETGTRKDLTDQPWPGVPNCPPPFMVFCLYKLVTTLGQGRTPLSLDPSMLA
ncbi:hypothetical protein NN561_012968 [Cricetulus griseus]